MCILLGAQPPSRARLITLVGAMACARRCRPALMIFHPVPKDHGIPHDHDLGCVGPRLDIAKAMTVGVIVRPELSSDKDTCVVGLRQCPREGSYTPRSSTSHCWTSSGSTPEGHNRTLTSPSAASKTRLPNSSPALYTRRRLPAPCIRPLSSSTSPTLIAPTRSCQNIGTPDEKSLTR